MTRYQPEIDSCYVNELKRYRIVLLSGKRSFGTIEIGYMGSFHEWQYEDDSGVETGRGYVDKIKVGYGYAFSKSAWIGLSISHVLAIEEFGGGNAQFLLMF